MLDLDIKTPYRKRKRGIFWFRWWWWWVVGVCVCDLRRVGREEEGSEAGVMDLNLDTVGRGEGEVWLKCDQ